MLRRLNHSLRQAVCAAGVLFCCPAAHGAEPLQSLTIKEYLGHRWRDELVHFPCDAGLADKDLRLVDDAGHEFPVQVSKSGGDGNGQQAAGTLWTVVTLEPQAAVKLQLLPGTTAVPPGVQLIREGDVLTLRNERLAMRLPQYPGQLGQPVEISTLAAPFVSIRGATEPWFGEGQWINEGPPVQVQQATTTIVEQGPVRIVLRQRLVFVDGHTYQAEISLAARQEAIVITEDSDEQAAPVAFRWNLQPGLAPDHVYWHNQWKKTERAESWALAHTAPTFDKDEILCKLRPWSFWWYGDLTSWAGFYKQGGEPLVGLVLLKPSRWSPHGWNGFDRTEIPITARSGGALDLTFSLVAGPVDLGGGKSETQPLHREWAVTVGGVKEHVTADASQARLRQLLIKHSEFPLDEVKDYGFDFAPGQPERTHPFLLFTPADVARVRRQAQEVASVKRTVDEARAYLVRCGGLDVALRDGGWQGFYKRYLGNGLIERLPEAYLGSDERLYGQFMAAAVKGMRQQLLDTFLERPTRPAIGAYGPWFSEEVTRLVLNYDLIAGQGWLTPEDEAAVRHAMVFGVRFLAHPDYWNTDRGLCSANPNMTSSILLPRGLTALLLDGHPQAPAWLTKAESELSGELQDWVSPGGAWIECPGYQIASLDGILLLAQAIRNVHGRDWFADPHFRETMDYFGFLLTPPDQRFPPQKKAGEAAPMVLPSIGDGFAGITHSYNGWMAKATAASDPAYAARQQFYWKLQGYSLAHGCRAKGVTLGLTDPELPAAPPRELARAFPGFGSVLRTSWTDPAASYVAHRTGPNLHHYHADYGSLVYYAKGVPLCVDFGCMYTPRRYEPWYHNQVSFDKADSPAHYGSSGELLEVRSLPKTIDYSAGKSWGGGNQRDLRHILLVKPADPQDATYVVMRDATVDGQPRQRFYWNLWCLSKTPTIEARVVHFPGQFGIDLDVHVLTPATPQIEQDHFAWNAYISYWANFSEEQYGMRITKQGSQEDFFTVLAPRDPGQPAAQVVNLDGVAVQVSHPAGCDVVLLAPERPTAVTTGEIRVQGEIAFVRQAKSGALRLAVVKGADAVASCGAWSLRSSGPTALVVEGAAISGESSGDAHRACLHVPAAFTKAALMIDDQAAALQLEAGNLLWELPAGSHTFSITGEQLAP